MNGYYIHKEPVLDRKKSVFSYELFFRKAKGAESDPQWLAVPVEGELISAVLQGGGSRS